MAETDWRSELQSFQRGVEEDTKHTAAEARQASLDAVHTLGSLGALGSLDAVHTLGGLGALGRARGAPDGGGARGPPEGKAAAPGGADGLDTARVAQSLTQARSWLDLGNNAWGGVWRGMAVHCSVACVRRGVPGSFKGQGGMGVHAAGPLRRGLRRSGALMAWTLRVSQSLSTRSCGRGLALCVGKSAWGLG